MEEDDWKERSLFSVKEKAVIRWAEEVANLTAKEHYLAFAEMRRYFSTGQLVSLTVLCGMWNMTGRVAEALHLVVEPPGGRIAFQEGSAE